MATLTPIRINQDRFPANWFNHKQAPTLIRHLVGRRAWIRRTIVANTFTPKAYEYHGIDWAALNKDEKFQAAQYLWYRTLRIASGQFPSNKRILRMLGCPPPGYFADMPNDMPWYRCGHPVCPFCYARRASEGYMALRDAYHKRPEGSELYVSSHTVTGKKQDLCKSVIRKRPAAVAAITMPGKNADRWISRVVTLSDDPDRLTGEILKVTTLADLAYTVAYGMSYPRRLLLPTAIKGFARSVELISTFGGRYKYLSRFGACRTDYVPGKGFMDFAGFEPKGC